MDKTQEKLLKGLKKGDSQSFKSIFDEYYSKLFYHALKFVCIKNIAEEVVLDVFSSLWQKRKTLDIHTSLQAYLYWAVKNKSISYLRSKYSNTESIDELSGHTINTSFIDQQTEQTIDFNELNELIQNIISQLPERCKIIFLLSRNSGLTYKQIAAELKISPESVKTQIGIAIKKIKSQLEEQ